MNFYHLGFSLNIALKQTPTNESFIFWAIICSVLLHVFLMLVIPNLNLNQVKLPKTLVIELVKAPEQPAATPPPVQVKPTTKEKSVIKTLVKPTRSLEAPPPPTQTEVLAVAPKLEAPPSPVPLIPVAIPEVAKTVNLSPADISAALNGYNSALWGKIGKYKQYPKIAQLRGWQGEVIVELLLDGNGNLKSKKILTSSGYDVLDKQALEMIDKAAPFPSPPEVLRSSTFSIRVPIPFKLE